MADTMDKFRASLNRGITAISVKTSSSLEKTKIKTHIDSLTTEIRMLYTQAGEAAYRKWESQELDYGQIEPIYAQIQQLAQRIEELTGELNSIDERDNQILGIQTAKPASEAVVCPGCGMEYDTPVKFCRICGSKVQK